MVRSRVKVRLGIIHQAFAHARALVQQFGEMLMTSMKNRKRNFEDESTCACQCMRVCIYFCMLVDICLFVCIFPWLRNERTDDLSPQVSNDGISEGMVNKKTLYS